MQRAIAGSRVCILANNTRRQDFVDIIRRRGFAYMDVGTRAMQGAIAGSRVNECVYKNRSGSNLRLPR